jgi:hypothetical protein
MDDAGASGASEQTPPKIKAEDNPWYLLATLYGVPEAGDEKLKAKNRIAWNRYFAANLDEGARAKLIEDKRHPAEELTPFSPDELREIATAFAKRSKASGKKSALPASNAHIDFSNVEFGQKAFFEGYLFSNASFFQVAFSGEASFGGATFSTETYFECEMDRRKKHEDELDFFALELQSRRVLQKSAFNGSGLPIALYGLVSDYGRSYARPLYALFAVAAVGMLLLLLSGAVAPWQSPGLSIANTLNVFGFRKDFFDAATIEGLPPLLKILAAVQTIFGTILLFLFGLGIRNKFRMK